MNDEPQHKHRKYWLLCIFAVFIAILGVILPETEFTPKQYINASNITVIGATITSGSLINLSDINNGYVNISESTTPFHVDINFSNVTHFSFPEIKARYFSTTATPSTHVVDLEIWCEMDQAFDDLKDLDNHEDWQYFTRHIPDYSHFIRPDGNVTIRFNHTANGNVNHRLYIDTARLITSVQYEQNNIVLNQYINQSGGSGASSLSQLTIDTNKSWNGYNIYNITIDNQTMSNKVTKTGDTMELNTSGKLIINHSYSSSPANQSVFSITKNNTNRTDIYNSGAQAWFLYDAADGYLGSIGYITVGGNPAIAYYSSSLPKNESNRVSIFFNRAQNRWNFQTVNATDNATNSAHLQHKGNFILPDSNSTVQAGKLAGLGNVSVYADSSGTLSVNRTAGSGIPMTSPDGTARCLRVSNTGVLTANAGAC